VRISLHNSHYFPHTIHFHGPILPNEMDGVPDMTQPAVEPGQVFTYSFVAKNPGTFFYHCHVQDQAHVPMGMGGMFIIEENRPDNHFAHVVVGAGRTPILSKATAEQYDSEYTLVYQDMDDRLNRIPAAYSDVREVERRMHRDYDVTQRKPNIFLVNGRAFPYTLRDTPIIVKPDQRVKLRILNAGGRTIYLHPHGHHPTITHLDGYPVPPGAQITRDVFEIGPAQRVDLLLRTGSDDRFASGDGVWMLHDHTPAAASNKGINPGGDHTAIVYESRLGSDGLPKGMEHHLQDLDAAYYRGEKPVFPPSTFASTPETYKPSAAPPAGGTFDYPTRQNTGEALPRLDLIETESHKTVVEACADRPRGFRRLYLRAGRAFAREGEVFGFDTHSLHAERCEEVEILFENADEVRHDIMLNGLSPGFEVNLAGLGTTSARFVTPDADITLRFHCHVPMHDRVGMIGEFVVGKGGGPVVTAQVGTPNPTPVPVVRTRASEPMRQGVGTVIATVPRMNRLIVDHEEIPGFMAAMEMSYPIEPPALLDGLSPGDKVDFTIDTQTSKIVGLKVLQRAN
jgi:FtsP/CotA-like multicopper oxidase with cupredoxin domain